MSLDFAVGVVTAVLGSDPEPWELGSTIILGCEVTGSEAGLTSRWFLDGEPLQETQAGIKPWVVDTTTASNSGYYGCGVGDGSGYVNATSMFVEIFASPPPVMEAGINVTPAWRELEEEGVECLPSDQEDGSD